MVGFTKKVSKRKLVCRRCGKVIPKGSEYYVMEWREGLYRRKRVLCVECAVKEAEEFARYALPRLAMAVLCRSDIVGPSSVVESIIDREVLRIVYICRYDPEKLAMEFRRTYLKMPEELDVEKVAATVLDTMKARTDILWE